jgi:tetratricopeptide (TPR) repeat protein
MPSIRSRPRSAVLTGLLLCLGGPLARAQPAELPPDRSSPNPQARALFAEGLRHYNVGEYDEAIERFRSAYQLDPAAGLLYNLAQAHRLKGDCAEALVLYRRFLATQPAGKSRERTEGRIAEMETCVAASRAARAPAVAPPRAAPPGLVLAPAPAPAEPPRRRWTSAPVLALGGVTLGLAGASGYFAVDAVRSGRTNSQLFTTGGNWSADNVSREARGRRDEKLAFGLVGGAMVAAGLALWLALRD